MKRPVTLIAVIAVLVVAFVGAAFTGYRTFSAQGEKAVARMDESEVAFLRKVKLIRKGMSYTELTAILGEPDRDALGLRPTWRVNKNPLNQVAIYLDRDGVRKVRWLSIGNFVYEPML